MVHQRSILITFMALLAVAVTGCTETIDRDDAGAAPSPSSAITTSPTPSLTPTASPAEPEPYVPAAARVAPTCDNIMSPAFTETIAVPESTPGAEASPDPMFDNGIVCWDTSFSRAFGWAPATAAQWDALVAELTVPGGGWFTETGPRGTYLTYKAGPDVADADGYAQTFLFTGDAVAMGFTKADVELVLGPPAA